MGLSALHLDRLLESAPRVCRPLTCATPRRALLQAAVRLLGWYHRLEVRGAEQLPRDRPVIFVAKRPRSWGLSEALLLVAGTGVEALPASRSEALEALRRGRSVLLFPGGERELHGPADTILWHGRRSHARLAALTGAPVVPVAFEGADRQHPWALRLSPRRTVWLPVWPLPVKLTLRVGAPLEPPATTDAAAVAAFSEAVAHAVRLLLLPARRRRRSLLPRW